MCLTDDMLVSVSSVSKRNTTVLDTRTDKEDFRVTSVRRGSVPLSFFPVSFLAISCCSKKSVTSSRSGDLVLWWCNATMHLSLQIHWEIKTEVSFLTSCVILIPLVLGKGLRGHVIEGENVTDRPVRQEKERFSLQLFPVCLLSLSTMTL